MSASSGGSYAGRRDVSADTRTRAGQMEVDSPASPIDETLGFGYEFALEARPQRRPRSPDDEEADEEAKRYCLDPPLPQRVPRGPGGARSPTAVDSPCHSPTPNVQDDATTSATYPANDETIVTQPAAAAPAPAAETKKKDKPRYPPLIVEKLPDWPAHFRAVSAKLGHPPNARPYQGGIRFLPESEGEYRVVQRYLTDLERESGLSWFAYSLPAERSVKVAIRGLPQDTPTDMIEEELRLHGYEPEYVRNIKAREGRPGCIFHAVLKRTPDFRKIYDTDTFLYMRGVVIEAWRGKKKPAQCHRCQKFRHSSHQCHRPLVCVRCGENHAARDCPRPRTEPATCANCAGDHPACNSKCPAYIKELKAKTKRAGKAAATQPPPKRPAPANESEAPSSTLMAAANGPSNRDSATSGRRKIKRGGKGKRKGKKPADPPATTDSNEADLAPSQAQATQRKSAVAAVGKTAQKAVKKAQRQEAGSAALVAEAETAPAKIYASAAPTQQRLRTDTSRALTEEEREKNKEFTACAVKLLMDLIKAIREGQDAGLVILDGLAALLTLYNG